MRNMSFALTKQQVRAKIKTVTRRIGWANLKPGERFQMVEKCQGLKLGEKIKPLGIAECVSNEFQELAWIKDMPYGSDEVAKEGFPEMTPEEFVNMFCKHMKCDAWQPVRRIEFKYV